MASISLRGIRKSYASGPEVLKGLDLDIADGEFMVLVGPSGCGKSTLLRLIAGLEEVSAGQLHIGALLANHVAPAARGIAMVFQSYALYPHMTVRQNMGFALALAGTPAAELRTAVGKVAEILRISHLLERKPKVLSGGERQRVAIGRAIVRQPKVFLFDEPLSNLDAALRAQTRVELAKLHQELGTTMVYVTHDQVEAMTLGQRVAVFNGGHLEQVAAPLELYRRPASQFVAGFIGALRMNFLPCSGFDDGRAVVTGSCRFALPARLRAPAAAAVATAAAAAVRESVGSDEGMRGLARGERAGIMLGIRPEHLRVVAADAGNPARIDLIEQLGDAQIIHATLKDSAHSVAIKLHGEMREDLRAQQIIGVAADAASLLLFDRQGMAIAAH